METVLIADDHEIVRRGVSMIIEGVPRQFNIIEAATCAEVRKVLSGQQVHYAILDISLADGNFFTEINHITPFGTQTKILVFSMNAERIYAHRLLAKGVRGFISKMAGMEELENAVQTILDGGYYTSPALKAFMEKDNKREAPENLIDTLSDRELEVVEYMVLGLGTKEIASKLNLDLTTISTYRKRALEKLEAQNIVELKNKFLLYKLRPDQEKGL